MLSEITRLEYICPMILFESIDFSRSLMQPLYDKENDCCLTFAQNFEALILSLKVIISNFSMWKFHFTYVLGAELDNL